MKKIAIVVAALFVSQMASAEISKSEAEEIVRKSECVNGKTVDEALKKKIKSRSQRDLGWKVFEAENQEYDVVRIILINKGMRVNYSWRVGVEGNVKPVSKRANQLCGI